MSGNSANANPGAEERKDVSVVLITPKDFCTYCHRRFGTRVWWRNRAIFLGEEVDHPIPRVLGGKVTVPCCSLCNRIKGSKRFESLADIQDFLLDRLLRGKSTTLKHARQVWETRATRAESVTAGELASNKSLYCETTEDSTEEEPAEEPAKKPALTGLMPRPRKIPDTFTEDSLPKP